MRSLSRAAGLSPISSTQVRRLRRTCRFARSCVNHGSRVLERLQSGDEFVQIGIAVAVESAHAERSLHFYGSPVATVEHFSSSIYDSGIRGLRMVNKMLAWPAVLNVIARRTFAITRTETRSGALFAASRR